MRGWVLRLFVDAVFIMQIDIVYSIFKSLRVSKQYFCLSPFLLLFDFCAFVNVVVNGVFCTTATVKMTMGVSSWRCVVD